MLSAYVQGYSIESASQKPTTVRLVSNCWQKPQPCQNGERWSRHRSSAVVPHRKHAFGLGGLSVASEPPTLAGLGQPPPPEDAKAWTAVARYMDMCVFPQSARWAVD